MDYRLLNGYFCRNRG